MASKEDKFTPEGLAERYPLLAGLTGSGDLADLELPHLEAISDEVRQAIIEVVSNNGGHLASPLGAVELAIALHHTHDFTRDFLVWDVGHQSMAHKILTGRFDQIHTHRQKGGLSGYPSRSEGPADVFGTGHSSTSISAALGMAVASEAMGETDRRAVAVIGDGAMTGGMAFEALSNAGDLKKNMLVILNDNRMSISKNVGAFSKYLSRIITGGLYNRAKGDLASFMESTMGNRLFEAARRLEHQVKHMLVPGGIFEDLGIRYVGPIDGNDIPTLVHCLRNIKEIDKPVLLHCVTTKGKGYPYAEEDPLKYHGVVPYDIDTGKFDQGSTPAPAVSFTQAFADSLIEEAQKDDRIVAITAGMSTGTGLSQFEQHFPERFFDVGICEQHAVTFAAGLATQGVKPVCAIYSTFLQRGYDQFIHDVCLQSLPVVFPIDRAGLVGEDSPTQQGAFDISFLRAVPNFTLLAPRDNEDLKLGLKWALKQDSAVGLRYARDRGPIIGGPAEERDITRGEILREGTDLYFLSVGPLAATCLQVAETLEAAGVSIGVADARYVKPLDTDLLDRISGIPIVTVEENTLEGGFGSAVLEYFETQDRLHEVRIRRLGIPDRFLPHGTRREQLEDVGLDAQGIERAARVILAERLSQPAK